MFIDSAGLDEHFLEDDIPADQYKDVKKKSIKQSGESDDKLKKHLEDWKKDEAKWKEGTRVWKKNDAKAKGALGKVIPNSIYMEIADLKMF